MALRLEDRWLWDFWLARDGPDHHLFYLQAPRALGDERLRHWNVSIGHAVSQDLYDWKVLSDALRPADSESDDWDNYTTWTGSVIQNDGDWFMFYTGSRRSEQGLVQRIGLAISTDLMNWKKHPNNPLITCDSRWYETLDQDSWHDQAWRDPWLFQHPTSGNYHALITARANQGSPDGRGVIGHATSRDLLHWEVHPPICTPGMFGHMEVPQLVGIGGRFYLLFCATGEFHSSAWREDMGFTPTAVTYYMIGPSPLGPFAFPSEPRMLGDPRGDHYSGKLVKDSNDEWHFLAYRHLDDQGHFIGELDDPIPVQIDLDGELHLKNDPRSDQSTDGLIAE